MKTVDTSGAIRKVDGIRRRLKGDTGRLYQNIGGVSGDSIRDNFDAEGRPAWEARVGNQTWPILNKTGTLRDTAENSARFGDWEVSGDEHRLNITSPEYGKYHQKTGVLTKGNRIIREYVHFMGDEIERIKALIREAVNGR